MRAAVMKWSWLFVCFPCFEAYRLASPSAMHNCDTSLTQFTPRLCILRSIHASGLNMETGPRITDFICLSSSGPRNTREIAAQHDLTYLRCLCKSGCFVQIHRGLLWFTSLTKTANGFDVMFVRAQMGCHASQERKESLFVALSDVCFFGLLTRQ